MKAARMIENCSGKMKTVVGKMKIVKQIFSQLTYTAAASLFTTYMYVSQSPYKALEGH